MPDITNRLKEQATLYAMDALSADERQVFEAKINSDASLNNYVRELNETLKLTSDSLTVNVSDEELHGQRNLLRARIRQLDSIKSPSPLLEKFKNIFETVLSPRQPVWAVASYVIVAFVVGRFLSTDPNQDNQPKNGFSSASIMSLIQEGALSDVQFEKSENIGKKNRNHRIS